MIGRQWILDLEIVPESYTLFFKSKIPIPASAHSTVTEPSAGRCVRSLTRYEWRYLSTCDLQHADTEALENGGSEETVR